MSAGELCLLLLIFQSMIILLNIQVKENVVQSRYFIFAFLLAFKISQFALSGLLTGRGALIVNLTES